MNKILPARDKILAAPNPDAPAPIQKAIRLMYAGAVLMAVSFIVSLASLGSVKGALHSANHKLTPSQINAIFEYLLVSTVILGIIGVGLWLLMARGAGNKRRWAQIVSTILFALYTLESVITFAQTTALVTIVFTTLIWAAGLGSVYLLWRPESKVWFLVS